MEGKKNYIKYKRKNLKILWRHSSRKAHNWFSISLVQQNSPERLAEFKQEQISAKTSRELYKHQPDLYLALHIFWFIFNIY